MKAEEIKPRDLRIGNILNLYGELVTVQEIGNHHASAYLTVEERFGHGYHIDQFQPIPLTEEVLLKCRFKLNKEKTLFEHTKCGLKLMCIVGLYYRANFPIKADINYLHQLQNLYYALTGEELEVAV